MKEMSLKKIISAAAVLWLMLALIIRPEIVGGLYRRLSAVITPIVTGIILAAVIDPAVQRLETLFSGKKGRKNADAAKAAKAAKAIAIASVYVIIVLVIAAVMWIVVPKLISSARLFINSLDGYYTDFRRRYDAVSDRDSLGLLRHLDSLIEAASSKLPVIFDKTFSGAADFINGAVSFFIGAVLSVYILAGKKQLSDFFSSAFRAIMTEKSYNRAAHILSTVNACLVNFISGQLTEAVVLGTLCFAGMVIFGFEYPLLISTIIGVTALVPVAGAFAGAVPSALMLFLVKPSSALWFIVFIIVLQQLENNFIYPKIVGKSVGLPPILILIAIVAGAQFGGAVGIMLGIPIISAVYLLVKEAVEKGEAE